VQLLARSLPKRATEKGELRRMKKDVEGNKETGRNKRRPYCSTGTNVGAANSRIGKISGDSQQVWKNGTQNVLRSTND